MVWKPTATTLTWPPVRHSQSGARRCSGSATCGPLKVRMLTLAPLNLPSVAHAAAWDGASADAGADAGAEAGAAVGAGVEAGVDAAGAGVADWPEQAASTSAMPTAGAIDLNRDTHSPPLDRRPVRPAY